jgi:lysophospholipase L1-like esterase
MSRVLFKAQVIAVLASLSGSGIAALQERSTPSRWITAWGTSQTGLGTAAMTNATARMIARVTISGEAVRLRFDNAYGTSPVPVGKVYVGHRVQKEILAPGSNRQVFFDHAAATTIPPGGSVESDPVPMKVIAGEDLAVSMYIPEANVRPSQHGGAFVTSYLSENGEGDVTADEVPPPPGSSVPTRTPFKTTTTSLLWLKAIDVLSSSATGGIVAFGDSITDGTCSTLDAHDRWEDWLAVRLDLAGVRKAVVNEGIAGNTITRKNLQPPADSLPALERFDRDVLSHHGITHLILFEGTNDIRREAPAVQVVDGMQEIIKRAKASGIKVIAATIIPRHNYPASGTNTGWDPAKTIIRHQVNEWIRTKAPFDVVLDFDKVIRDPANPDQNYPSFHCDGIHPSPHGYYELAKSVPLDVFR